MGTARSARPTCSTTWRRSSLAATPRTDRRNLTRGEAVVALKIKQDHSRFREIIRGRIKANLRKYIQNGEMIGKNGKDLITIPVPSIDHPHFRYRHKIGRA